MGADGLAQARIRRVVQRGGAVVQDENFGVAHERTGNGQALALAAGKVLAALRDLGVQTALAGRDKFRRLRGLERDLQLGIRCVLLAPAEILRDGPGKQDGLLRHDADLAAQLPGRIVAYIDAVDKDAPARRVIETGDEIDERGLSGARAADDTDGLPAPHAEAQAGQRLRARAAIAQRDIFEHDCVLCSGIILSGLARERHTRILVKHAFDAAGAGSRLRDRNDQVRELDELDQDLGHVIDERHDLSLRQRAALDLPRARPDQGDDRAVDEDVGQGVHQGGNAAHKELQTRQALILLRKLCRLLSLLMEGTDDAHAAEILARAAQKAVQPGLRAAVERHGQQHDAEHDDGQQGNGHRKDERRADIDGKGHDHRTEHDERRAQEQAQHQIHAGLQLIDVARHARDERGRAEMVHLAVGQALDMAEQSGFQPGRKADGGLRREILRRDGADEADERQTDHQQHHTDDVMNVARGDADVDDLRDDKRHEQLERSLEQLEQRP